MADGAQGRLLHEPVQRRSRETLDRFVQAAADLLKEKPFTEITVPEIARRAESSVGAFYGRFQSKERLFDYLHFRVLEDARARWTAFFEPERWRGQDAAAIVGAMVKELAARYRRDPEPLRAALDTFRASPPGPELRRAAAAANTAIRDGLAALLVARGVEQPVEQKIELVLEVVRSTLLDRFVFPDLTLHASTMSDNRAVEELVAMSCVYLGIEEPGPTRPR